MYPDIDKLKPILLKENYISEQDAKAAEADAKDGAAFVDHLIRQEVLTKTLLGQALAEAYKLPFADLSVDLVTKDALALIPEDIAKTYRIVVAAYDDKTAMVASDRPEAIDPKKILPLLKGHKVRLAYTLPEYIDEAMEHYEQPLATRFSQIIESGQRVAPEILEEILRDALNFKASDIHFEPHGDMVTVRFRVDGSLREAGRLPKTNYENVLNRIKVESGMRIDEHLTPQDGALQRRSETFRADFRVSLIPTVEGEKVVMRVLGSYVAGLSFTDVGFSEIHREMVERAISRPFGMILAVGPTGSGKTTTLYSLLKLLNKPDVNITTIEDPVEYKMAGTNQIQVREAGNVTFAKGLRAIVRQDPDVILVGEIRDHETAEISVNAALTGHLLLSSFHANDAATAVPRLVDIGIEPFLLSSTLEIIVAQRLARRICSNCRYSISVADALKTVHTPGIKWSEIFKKNDTIYAGKGCNVCGGSGYHGRVALIEIIEVTPEMQELMLHSPTSRQIEQLARKQGSPSMFDDGIDKIRLGVTTVNEIVRVVPPKVGDA